MKSICRFYEGAFCDNKLCLPRIDVILCTWYGPKIRQNGLSTQSDQSDQKKTIMIVISARDVEYLMINFSVYLHIKRNDYSMFVSLLLEQTKVENF